MSARSPSHAGIRLAELMMALSIATDYGMGQPAMFAMQSCVLTMRLGDKLGWSREALRAAYYQALLRYIGCNAETRLLAAVFGDELAFRTEGIHADSAGQEMLSLVMRFIRQANAGASPLQMVQAMIGGLVSSGRFIPEFFKGHCEVAQRLAERLGFEQPIVDAIRQVYARWDGKGTPALKGEAIAPGMLLVSLAQDAIYAFRLGGVDEAIGLAKKRRSTLYAPKDVDIFCQHAPTLLSDLEPEPSWNAILHMEPHPRRELTEAEFDTACEALADFADIKSPYTLGHSPGVARVAGAAAQAFGLPETDRVSLRRAGMLHDLGRVGVSAGIWTKPGPLTEREWEQVRLHPYYTGRILARPDVLASLGMVAALHHERLDGSGYPQQATAPTLSPAARLLAAADAYHALTEPRPHRPAQDFESAAKTLQAEARAGRLDSDAVHGVLSTVEGTRPVRKEGVAGLSEREIEVLRLVARGLTIKQIGQELVIAPKTADNHIQHIYAKIGVSTRAGATLFAVEQNLLL